MTTQEQIKSFFAEKAFAVAGVSRSGTKFGNSVYTELKDKGFTVYPINPNAESIGEEKCYPDIASLPDDVGAIVAVVPPAQTADLAEQAGTKGIRHFWMQRGAESSEAIAACEKAGIDYVAKECVLMFAEPVGSIHKFHRFLKRIFGGLPK